jgi:hypothetical protein
MSAKSMYEKMSAESFFDTFADNAIASITLPPIAQGQSAKTYLLEDLRLFLCSAISPRLSKYEKSSKPIRDDVLLQELILYYHILGYTDEAAREKIISVLDRKEVWDGE